MRWGIKLLGSVAAAIMAIITNHYGGADAAATITIEERRIEAVQGGEVVLKYRLQDDAATEAIVCILLERLPSREVVLSETCFNIRHMGNGTDVQSMKLDGIKPGNYEARMRIRGDNNGQRGGITLHIEVQPQTEIVPSYSWQPLHAWHTIPAGLETRLPLDALTVKDCRIPEPWRLQLAYPYPCKFFLRLDLTRSMLIEDILSAAAKNCKRLPFDCFALVDHAADRKPLEHSESVESSNLFNRPAVKLQVAESCHHL